MIHVGGASCAYFTLLLTLRVVAFICVAAQTQQSHTNTDIIKMQSVKWNESIIIFSVHDCLRA
jgi:hypothetical protein